MTTYFYGIYRGICVENIDPQKLNRIKLTVPQILGSSVTDWALPCTPITNTAEHLDHKKHLASEVAALLQAHADHSVSGTTGGATVSTFGSHTHSFSFTTAHTNNHTGKTPDSTNSLDHEHVDITDPLDRDGTEEGLTAAEHTYHRNVPAVNQMVWVMFVGGDPDFPVWMGV